jgi:hypothetical protein
MIRMRIWVMMVIVSVIMLMPMEMIHIKPASPRTKTVAELTILDIASRG